MTLCSACVNQPGQRPGCLRSSSSSGWPWKQGAAPVECTFAYMRPPCPPVPPQSPAARPLGGPRGQVCPRAGPARGRPRANNHHRRPVPVHGGWGGRRGARSTGRGGECSSTAPTRRRGLSSERPAAAVGWLGSPHPPGGPPPARPVVVSGSPAVEPFVAGVPAKRRQRAFYRCARRRTVVHVLQRAVVVSCE